jgi:hypothetical protein
MWDTFDPQEPVWIPASTITEAELTKKGIEYRKSSSERDPGYVVKKGSLRKFGEYTLLTLATPLTVIVDGTGFVLCTVVLSLPAAALEAVGDAAARY